MRTCGIQLERQRAPFLSIEALHRTDIDAAGIEHQFIGFVIQPLQAILGAAAQDPGYHIDAQIEIDVFNADFFRLCERVRISHGRGIDDIGSLGFGILFRFTADQEQAQHRHDDQLIHAHFLLNFIAAVDGNDATREIAYRALPESGLFQHRLQACLVRVLAD